MYKQSPIELVRQVSNARDNLILELLGLYLISYVHTYMGLVNIIVGYLNVKHKWITLNLVLGCIFSVPVSASSVEFGKDVRQILSDKCFACHGPDTKKSGLRLDSRESFIKGGKGGEIFEVKNPEDSEILRRIFSNDKDELMPPPETKKPLSQAEKEILKAWVVSGAEYQNHWAFEPVVRPPVPGSSSGWGNNEIDRFILRKLEEKQLKPNPEASRFNLARRLALDLTGLLPSSEQLDEFIRETSEEAFFNYLNQLMSSEAYGERWARDWLDLARYADTNGYEKDRNRTIWPYRDWVIDALNQNMPFNTFSIAQLAGDMLDDATPSDIIATGFHRNTMTNEEGGIDVEEFRYHSIVDRVKTTGATWMGLTLNCAQCHNHKYDPISHKDYFKLFALFNNADEPEYEILSEQDLHRKSLVQSEISELYSSRRDTFARDKEGHSLFHKKLNDWIRIEKERAVHWEKQEPKYLHSDRGATLTTISDLSVLASGNKPNKDLYTIRFLPGKGSWTGLRIEVMPDNSLPFGGPGRAHFFQDGDFFLSEVELYDLSGKARNLVKLTSPSASKAKNGRPIENTLDGKRDTGWQIGNRTAEYHQAVYHFSDILNLEENDFLELKLNQHFIHQVTLGRFRISLTQSKDTKPIAKTINHDAELILYKLKTGEKITDEAFAILEEQFLDICSEAKSVNDRIKNLKKSLLPRLTTLVMKERDEKNKRKTFIRHRGEFLSPTVQSPAGIPEFLKRNNGAPEPQNRLEFARWLFNHDNPLTARVFVNRTWARFFGKGIVSTLDDLGAQGAAPSHPELLDWLADEFRQSGWNIKYLHQLIVSSATYRQSSVRQPDADAIDPFNNYYHRGDRIRLDAEMIRDTALQVSGLLSLKVGGAGVFPVQDPSVTKLAYGSPKYSSSSGENKYRRGIYTFWKRTSPYASFMMFDSPSSDMVCTKREKSNTPLQSLVLLNDGVYVEAAQSLAKSMISEYKMDLDQFITKLYFKVLSRKPTANEILVIKDFLNVIKTSVKENKTAGLKVPQGISHMVSESEWTSVLSACRAILNTDEMITRP